jgi:hypothetical protein
MLLTSPLHCVARVCCPATPPLQVPSWLPTWWPTAPSSLRQPSHAAVRRRLDGVLFAVCLYLYFLHLYLSLCGPRSRPATPLHPSGAYNRTLTPFGFQSEERTLWQAPETYAKMSPFM